MPGLAERRIVTAIAMEGNALLARTGGKYPAKKNTKNRAIRAFASWGLVSPVVLAVRSNESVMVNRSWT